MTRLSLTLDDIEMHYALEQKLL